MISCHWSLSLHENIKKPLKFNQHSINTFYANVLFDFKALLFSEAATGDIL